MKHYEGKVENWQHSSLAHPGFAMIRRNAVTITQERPMLVRTQIERKLVEGLSPARLDIQDESARHRGHAGSRPDGESHFAIEIVSLAFEGKSQVARQRMVYALLAEEMHSRVHALTLSTLTPAEEARRAR